MSRMHVGALAAVAILGGVAAGAQAPARTGPDQVREWPTYLIAEAPDGWHAAISQGDLIIAAVSAALQNELRRDVREGIDRATASCHIDTSAVEVGVERGKGFAVGRTSARLRNPTNRPRPWAAAVVARHATARASDVDGYVVDLGDRIGLLRPIAEQPMCDACHGPVEKLSPRVAAELKDRYPADHGTGFRSGDLRGWFWVELPKQ
jgi:uncharacterized protein DUF3365